MRKDSRPGHVKQGRCFESPSYGPQAPPAATCGPSSAQPHLRQRLSPSLSNRLRPSPAPPEPYQLLRGTCLTLTAAAAPPAATAQGPPAPRHRLPSLPLQTLVPTPSHPGSAPHVTGLGGSRGLSSSVTETRSGCRRVGRGLASHDGVGWLPTRPLGAAMLEAELLAACAGGSRPPVRSSLAINSGAAPRPLRACSESPQLEGE